MDKAVTEWKKKWFIEISIACYAVLPRFQPSMMYAVTPCEDSLKAIANQSHSIRRVCMCNVGIIVKEGKILSRSVKRIWATKRAGSKGNAVFSDCLPAGNYHLAET